MFIIFFSSSYKFNHLTQYLTFSDSKFNFSKLFFFSFLKICLLEKVVCITLVLVLIIALLVATIVEYEANRVLVHNETTMSFTFQTLRKEDYHEYCLNGGESYVVSMKDEEEVVACMCTSFYRGGRCEKCMCWT